MIIIVTVGKERNDMKEGKMMTRKEVAQKVIELIEHGYKVEVEVNCENRKVRLLASHTGYKWLIEYTRNDKGVFTASDVRLFDAYTESLRDNTADGRLIKYKSY
jgi:hypothetical protein